MMKQYKGYTARVVFDESANVLHGRIEGINDVVNFQVKSVHELDDAFTEAVEDYLDYCSERGETPEKPYSGKFVVRIDPSLHSRIAAAAALTNQSLNRWVTVALEGALISSTLPDVRMEARRAWFQRASTTPDVAIIDVVYDAHSASSSNQPAKLKSGSRMDEIVKRLRGRRVEK